MAQHKTKILLQFFESFEEVSEIQPKEILEQTKHGRRT